MGHWIVAEKPEGSYDLTTGEPILLKLNKNVHHINLVYGPSSAPLCFLLKLWQHFDSLMIICGLPFCS